MIESGLDAKSLADDRRALRENLPGAAEAVSCRVREETLREANIVGSAREPRDATPRNQQDESR